MFGQLGSSRDSGRVLGRTLLVWFGFGDSSEWEVGEGWVRGGWEVGGWRLGGWMWRGVRVWEWRDTRLFMDNVESVLMCVEQALR